MMRPDYEAWILEQATGNLHGRCAAITLAMGQTFPELTRVRGHVHSPIHTTESRPQGYPHWWLTTAEGEIIDPTAAQFPCAVLYEPWDESHPGPTGKCLSCGDYCYNYASVCSKRCAESYRADLGL